MRRRALIAATLLAGCASPQIADPDPSLALPSPVPRLNGCGLDQLPASWVNAFEDAPVGHGIGDDVRLRSHDWSRHVALYARRNRSGRCVVVLVRPDEREKVVFDVGTGADTQVFSCALEWPWAVVVVVGLTGWNDFVVLARNLDRGEPFVIQRSRRDASGNLLPAPMLAPVIRGGTAYLPEVQDDRESSSLVGFDLASGTSWKLAPRKGAACPVFFDGLLIWQEFGRKGALSAIAALDVGTRRIVNPPDAMESASPSYLASDGSTLLWTERGTTSSTLTFVRGVKGAPSRTVVVPHGDPGFPSVSGHYATYDAGRPWLVDLDSGQYVPLTIEYGLADLTGDLLGLKYYSEDKAGASLARILDLRVVPPLVVCR